MAFPLALFATKVNSMCLSSFPQDGGKSALGIFLAGALA